MQPPFGCSSMNGYPIIVANLIFLLVSLSGCAARMAQQEIDTLKEQAIALQQAREFIRLDRIKRNSKCREAHATLAKLILPSLETEHRSSRPKFPDSQLQPVLDYLRHAYIIQGTWKSERQPQKPPLLFLGISCFHP